MGNDTAPLLLVFDGLDELSNHEDTARTLALRFIANVTSLLATLSPKCSDARALVLGRDAAVTAGREEARLGPDTLLHGSGVHSCRTAWTRPITGMLPRTPTRTAQQHVQPTRPRIALGWQRKAKMGRSMGYYLHTCLETET